MHVLTRLVAGPRLIWLLAAFWALWYSLVAATNVAGGLKAAGWVAAGWPLASGNYALVVSATALYAFAPWATALLFAAAVAGEGILAVLFWRAVARRGASQDLLPALGLGVLLWGAFVLADEIFLTYQFAGGHMVILCAHLLTYLLTDRMGRDTPPV
jgi:hypothetical protein